jgi:nucleoside-diphosphate-sugar epimerase
MIRHAGASAGAPGQAFNAVDDGTVTWREFIDWMCADLACPAPRLSAPGALVWPLSVLVENTAKAFGKKDSPLINKYRVRVVMRDSHYSTEKAKKLLGYRPRVSTREGVRRTIAWYRQYAGLGGSGG